jgi:hypothetical protein
MPVVWYVLFRLGLMPELLLAYRFGLWVAVLAQAAPFLAGGIVLAAAARGRWSGRLWLGLYWVPSLTPLVPHVNRIDRLLLFTVGVPFLAGPLGVVLGWWLRAVRTGR